MTERYRNWGRWGYEDELGTLNLIGPRNIVRACAEVKKGMAYTLAIPFDANGPQRGGSWRFNPIHTMLRDGADVVSGAFEDLYGTEDRQIRSTDDMVVMPLQCGTQWDSLAHIIHDGKIYNGYNAAEVSSAGARRNGIEKAAAALSSRGVLIDFPRLLGRSLLPGEGVTAADLDLAVKAEGVVIEEGDVVLIRTGAIADVRARGDWGNYAGGPAPGLALDSLSWIHALGVAAIATDTWGAEVLPNEVAEIRQPFHVVAITYMGLMIGEIFDMESLSLACGEDGRYGFFFSALPLPITGAVGSPVNPLALR